MKTFLFAILLVVSSFSCKAQAYSYISFPTSHMVWNGYTQYGGMGTVSYPPWPLEMNTDTLVNNLTYHIVRQGSSTYAYLREDSAKKIYYVRNYDVNFIEEPLYDFSLNVGDTLFVAGGFLYVTKIDTPVYFGIARRTLHLIARGLIGCPCFDTWIEGLGSNVGPLGNLGNGDGYLPLPWWLCNITVNGFMACYDSVIYYDTTAYPSHCYISGITELQNTTISCFPNPASSILKINLSDAESWNLQVYNAFGQLQLQKNSIAGDQTASIDITALSDGLYFLRVTNQFGEVNTVRFVKMK